DRLGLLACRPGDGGDAEETHTSDQDESVAHGILLSKEMNAIPDGPSRRPSEIPVRGGVAGAHRAPSCRGRSSRPYRAGAIGDGPDPAGGTNLSYRVRAKRIATSAARSAAAAYVTNRRLRPRGAVDGQFSGRTVTGSMNRYPFLGTVSI